MSGAARVAAPDFSRQIRNPQLMAAALALHDNRLSDAEPLLDEDDGSTRGTRCASGD
ncbi:MAG: hypothetical protein IPI83_00320 [Sphingomonadales bacterium]|nr:hypothetical protein [Sphingomonadales bacterium]